MDYKYIVLDFGKVISAPSTGDWDKTAKFLELIDINKLDEERFKSLRKKYGCILSEKVITLDEEYNMFFRFYDEILSEIDYPNYKKSISEQIAYDRTYNINKYILYDNIHQELERLKEQYILILLTDNWPSVTNYLIEKDLGHYFEKIYISSIYGCEKKDKVFFDYPINDFGIKPGEALFIDDNESNLDAAQEKGFDVMLMDREKIIKNSKHKIISDLNSLVNKNDVKHRSYKIKYKN